MFSSNKGFKSLGSISQFIDEYTSPNIDGLKQVGNKRLYIDTRVMEGRATLVVRSYDTDMLAVDCESKLIEVLSDSWVSSSTVNQLKGLFAFAMFGFSRKDYGDVKVVMDDSRFSVQSSLVMRGNHKLPVIAGMKLDQYGNIHHIPKQCRLENRCITMESTKKGRAANRALKKLVKTWNKMGVSADSVVSEYLGRSVADPSILVGEDLYLSLLEGGEITPKELPFILLGASLQNYTTFEDAIKFWYQRWREANCRYEYKDVTELKYFPYAAADLTWEQVYK